ncbi:hypothetical protein HBI73_106670 [Parastagonospora nodorum]|nr:hypothetical protein HBI73_106670 [Parastagonospora nodorum]
MAHIAQSITSLPFNHPAHNILLTLPRTASHLLVRMLNLPNQPSLSRHPRDGYFFMPSLQYRYQHDTYNRPIAQWTDEEHEEMNATIQNDLTTWEKWVQDAQLVGDGTFVKEHINFMLRPDAESDFLHTSDQETEGNPTCIPDTFLQVVRPTFLIRDPGLVVPSLMRAAIDLEGMEAVSSPASEKAMRCEASYRWHVALYKHLTNLVTYPCKSHHAGTLYPIVLDASDLINPALVKKYAAAIGLDQNTVQFNWQSGSANSLGGMEARMKDTLLGSEGVVMDKLVGRKQFHIEEFGEQYTEEFGSVLGARVIRLIKNATDDYQWLYERRMQLYGAG